MTDELVKRLRGDWFGYEVSLKAIDAMEEAADRIEQLVATNKQLTAERDYTEGTNDTLIAMNQALTTERDAAYANGYSDAETEISKSALGQRNDFLSAEYANAVARIKDLNELLDEALAEWSKYASAWMTAEGKLEDAVQGLEKCQEELDAYSRQEYPLDHTVHERYRQRDYDANPARITLAALKGERHE